MLYISSHYLRNSIMDTVYNNDELFANTVQYVNRERYLCGSWQHIGRTLNAISWIISYPISLNVFVIFYYFAKHFKIVQIADLRAHIVSM